MNRAERRRMARETKDHLHDRPSLPGQQFGGAIDTRDLAAYVIVTMDGDCRVGSSSVARDDLIDILRRLADQLEANAEPSPASSPEHVEDEGRTK